MSEPDHPTELALVSRTLGGLPIVNAVLDRLRLPGLLEGVLPVGDVRVKVTPSTAIRLVVTNLVLGREPLYGLGEWTSHYDPALLGLTAQEVGALNDDRVGRALEALFDADRASLLTTVVLGAVSEFAVDTSQLHNDSTSVSVHGAYHDAVGTVRGGKPTPVITFAHSKDHRPDLKQLVWILTVSADGAVPVAYRLADGNTVDDPTHVPTWDGLVGLLGRTAFLYVADSKLCSRKAMGHIDGHSGRFVTVMPRSRAEDSAFRDHLQTHTPPWTEAARHRGARLGEPDEIYSTTPAPLPCAEGYRIVWVHSTAKVSRDAAARAARIEAGVAAIEALDVKLNGPRSRFKTRVAFEQAAAAALTSVHADRWVAVTVTETLDKTYKQERAGRPGPATRYRQIITTRFALHHDIRPAKIRYDAASDGCFPLISNDRVLTDAPGTGRLPLPAAPRTPPPPAQVRPRRRTGAAPQPSQDRGAVLLPVPGPPRRCPHRTRGPPRHATSQPEQHQALPRVPQLHGPLHRTAPCGSPRIVEGFSMPLPGWGRQPRS